MKLKTMCKAQIPSLSCTLAAGRWWWGSISAPSPFRHNAAVTRRPGVFQLQNTTFSPPGLCLEKSMPGTRNFAAKAGPWVEGSPQTAVSREHKSTVNSPGDGPKTRRPRQTGRRQSQISACIRIMDGCWKNCQS